MLFSFVHHIFILFLFCLMVVIIIAPKSEMIVLIQVTHPLTFFFQILYQLQVYEEESQEIPRTNGDWSSKSP